jgi:tetratricopeptide (TPR) repeat protein/tRNA A-37 threonylcarbamoyl transferase component Bud32
MNTIKSQAVCRGCGARLPSGPLAGLCPACLLDSALSPPPPPQAQPPPSDLPSGAEFPWQFGRYQVLEEIARGGAGVVFRARDEGLCRDVALKFLRAGPLATREDTRRLFLEARAAARLRHPHIVPVFEVGGPDDTRPFLAMAFLPGGTLAQRLKRGTVSPTQAARWMSAVARAVHHAHLHGILHRDLKPGNILFDAEDSPHATSEDVSSPGQPMVADFGLARLLDEEETLTRTDALLGTPAYLAPEQAVRSAGEITTAADIHALGAILYETLTGRPPFADDHLPSLLRQIAETPPVPPRQLKPTIPRDLETICLKCLEKEPSKRYPSAAAFAEDLERFLKDEPIQARPIGPTAKAWRWCQRNRTVTASAALFVALVAGFSWHNWRTVTELRNTAPSLIALAESLVTAQKFPEALERVEVALRLQPDNADYLLLKANILQALLRLPEARDHYAQALKLNFALASARENLALCERLLAIRSGHADWTMEELMPLYEALLKQGRSAEAYAVSRQLDAAKGRFVEFLQAKLNQAGITNQLGWSQHRPAHLGSDPFGSPTSFKPASRNYLYLNLDHSPIADLTPLRGLPLQELSLRVCANLANLRPLQGMPLVRLAMNFGQVDDLSPLAQSPLEVLEFTFNNVTDLSPLSSVRNLRTLYFANVDVSDLSPLRGLPVEVLTFSSTLITSLEPLRDLPRLKLLGFDHVRITDLSPLSGLPLGELQIQHVEVFDISPLRGLPLQFLNLADCPRITDLSPLKECTSLEKLILPPNAGDIAFLRDFPNLKEISYRKPLIAAADFWKAYDARNAQPK